MDARSYNEYCGVAKALDVIGERWTLLVVRNLLLGPLRYSELLRGLPGITTNLLAKRLREMAAHGLVERVRTSPAEGGHAYRLTPLGSALEPAIHALGRWGWQRMHKPRSTEHRSIEWLLVALRRRYRGGETLRAELVADGAPYRIVLTRSAAEISRGGATRPEVRVRGDGAAIARLFLEGWSGTSLPRGVEIEGSAEKLRALVNAFERGERASA